MKLTYSLLAVTVLLAISSCIDSECRDCEAFNYDAASFNPDYDDEDLNFREVSTGETVTFERLQALVSPGGEVCASSDENIYCISGAAVSYRNTDLGIDMILSFEVSDGSAVSGPGERVVMVYEFKGTDATQYVRTHGVVIEPEVQLVSGSVALRDSVVFGDTVMVDVLDLQQTAEVFLPIGDRLPVEGRFVDVYFKEGTGLVGLRDVNGRLFVRQ